MDVRPDGSKLEKPDAEVPEKASRRRVDAEYKLRILEEADRCTEPGQQGELLRREGLYSSHLTAWRRQREEGVLNGLREKKRGRKPNRQDPKDLELERLRRENQKLEDRLRQAETIIEVQKSLRYLGCPAGSRERQEHLIEAAEDLGKEVGVRQACQALSVPRSSLYRRRQVAPVSASQADRRRPPRALSPQERQQVKDELYSERHRDSSPREVYARLLDEDCFLCSVRTMYRILEGDSAVQERRNQLRHPVYAKPELLATGANQVCSWDITKLRGPKKWTYYYLYVILDIYSRYAVGWLLAHCEGADLASGHRFFVPGMV